MKAHLRGALPFVSLVLLAGCGSVEAHSAMLKRPQSPSAEGRVELYLEGQEVGRPVEELGLVQAFGSGSMANPEDVAQALADRGAELGCDAITKATIDIGYNRAHAAGVCVKFAGPRAPAAAAYVKPSLKASPPPVRPPPEPGPRPRGLEPLPSSPKM
jgi:hypothetical protein